MRLFLLKCFGLVLWALFLFAPFIARANEESTFYVLPAQRTFSGASSETALAIWNLKPRQTKNIWQIELNARRDDDISHSQSPPAYNRYTQPDEQDQNTFRVGLHLNYVF